MVMNGSHRVPSIAIGPRTTTRSGSVGSGRSGRRSRVRSGRIGGGSSGTRRPRPCRPPLRRMARRVALRKSRRRTNLRPPGRTRGVPTSRPRDLEEQAALRAQKRLRTSMAEAALLASPLAYTRSGEQRLEAPPAATPLTQRVRDLSLIKGERRLELPRLGRAKRGAVPGGGWAGVGHSEPRPPWPPSCGVQPGEREPRGRAERESRDVAERESRDVAEMPSLSPRCAHLGGEKKESSVVHAMHVHFMCMCITR